MENLQISRPGSFRMNASFTGIVVSNLVYWMLQAADKSPLTGKESTIVLLTCGFMTTLCIYGIVSGWKRLKTSKSDKLARFDALNLGRYVQGSPGAMEIIDNHLHETGNKSLADLTYGEVEDMRWDLSDAKENDILNMRRRHETVQ